MTRADQTLDCESRDCEACALTLLDALAWPSDSDIFEFNYRTGVSIDLLYGLHLAARDAHRKRSGFMFDLLHTPAEERLIPG